jgi:hypothetical protein
MSANSQKFREKRRGSGPLGLLHFLLERFSCAAQTLFVSSTWARLSNYFFVNSDIRTNLIFQVFGSGIRCKKNCLMFISVLLLIFILVSCSCSCHNCVHVMYGTYLMNKKGHGHGHCQAQTQK